jgi:hypothetical protein
MASPQLQSRLNRIFSDIMSGYRQARLTPPTKDELYAALYTLSEQARRKTSSSATDEALLIRLAEDLKKHLLSRDIPHQRRNAPKTRGVEVVRALAAFGLPANATFQHVERAWAEAKKAYKVAMMRNHPDVSGQNSTALAQQLNADHDLRKKAYQKLKKALG